MTHHHNQTNTKKVPPRPTPLREDFYMAMAFWMASKSKDPRTQVGALIIGEDNAPLSWGYNGPPKQVNDADINWDRPEKYDWILHAEDNAIDYANNSIAGSTLYVTCKPCKRCMLRMVREGIKKVVFYPAVPEDENSILAIESDMQKTEEIAKKGGVSLVEYKGNLNWMRDRMKWMENKGLFV